MGWEGHNYVRSQPTTTDSNCRVTAKHVVVTLPTHQTGGGQKSEILEHFPTDRNGQKKTKKPPETAPTDARTPPTTCISHVVGSTTCEFRDLHVPGTCGQPTTCLTRSGTYLGFRRDGHVHVVVTLPGHQYGGFQTPFFHPFRVKKYTTVHVGVTLPTHQRGGFSKPVTYTYLSDT